MRYCADWVRRSRHCRACEEALRRAGGPVGRWVELIAMARSVRERVSQRAAPYSAAAAAAAAAGNCDDAPRHICSSDASDRRSVQTYACVRASQRRN